METRDLVAFAGRDWAAVTAQEEDYWRQRKRRLGVVEGLRAGEALRRQVQVQRPNWPSTAERQEDLATHVRVAEMLSRVAAA